MLKRTLIAAVACAALLAVPTTASASVTFSLKTGKAESPGGAVAKGTAKLQSRVHRKKTQYRVVVRAKLDDRCPKDGYGAYLEVRAYLPSGDSSLRYSSDQKSDERGCKPKAMAVKLQTGWAEQPYQIDISLTKKDQQTGDITFEDGRLLRYTPSQLGF